MNQTFTLLVMLCITATVTHAQPQSHVMAQKHARLFSDPHPSPQPSTAKTTAIQQRLTGRVFLFGGVTVNDTAMYKYDFGRGSEFDFADLAYFDDLELPNIRNRKYIYFDSTVHPMQSRSRTMRYAHGAPVSQYYYQSGSNTARTRWLYNNKDSIITLINENLSSGNWVQTGREDYEYDAGGRLVADSTSGSKTTYEYNAQGLLDTVTYYLYGATMWHPSGRYIYIYTGQHATDIIHQRHTGTGFSNYERVERAYTAGQEVMEKKYSWDLLVLVNWKLESEEYRHLNNDNLPDSVFFRYTAADTTIKKISYTSFGNPATITHYKGSMALKHLERFWYEEYDPTAVKDIKTTTTLTVYPNPARDQLHIATANMKPGNINYTVVNSLGQSIISGYNKVDNDRVTIDIRQLSPGIYWLHLHDAGGEAYKATFSKAE